MSEECPAPSTPPSRPVPPVENPDSIWNILCESQPFLTIPTKQESSTTETQDITRIACISDTHGEHRNIPIPKCDILIHGGDFTSS
mmetsp:Transcript_9376/g.13446  ORF Transcript_9376/g.13446 Transcript_9376/m.13446 type:complete len:86 (+) Transcript_9376:184-441(+)